MISIKSEVSKLQLTIDGLDEWCNVSDLHLKFRKCVVMMILNKLYIINGNYLFDVHIFKRVINIGFRRTHLPWLCAYYLCGFTPMKWEFYFYYKFSCFYFFVSSTWEKTASIFFNFFLFRSLTPPLAILKIFVYFPHSVKTNGRYDFLNQSTDISKVFF